AIPDGIAPYDDERLLEEAYLLTDWYMPALFGEPTPDGVRRSYRDVWLSVFPMVHAQPPTLVLRDYHVNNLMRVAGYDGIKACGLLDFQDALWGPGAYDLMSLLEDSRREIEMNLISGMLERYHEAFPDIDWNSFIDVFTILGAQRHAKVIGIFTRLNVRDAKPGYLTHIPRLWRLVERSLEHPRLAGLSQWLDEHIGPEMRRIPPCQAAAK
ncbi:MAG: phosphotransferase, partial [Rhodospirillales bacterium]